MCNYKAIMNKKNENFINEFFVCAYIYANAICVGSTIHCVRDAINGDNTAGGIIINGILAALTAQRAIHYYRLNHKQK